jgi:hypothetical protein
MKQFAGLTIKPTKNTLGKVLNVLYHTIKTLGLQVVTER